MKTAQAREPWIGEIPYEWRLISIKRLVSVKITDGPHETPELSDEGIQFISAEAIKNHQTLDALATSIIHHAVTQGLNPAAKMKPSGIDWAAEVPAHWRVRQIKRICTLVRGQFTHRPRNDPALYDGEYPFVQTGDIPAARKYILTYSQTLNELGLNVSKMFPRGTLVMSIAANIGDVAILDFEACFPDSMIGMIPRTDTHRGLKARSYRA